MRRKRKPKTLPRPPLTEDHVLAWADQYHALTGRWPKKTDGPVRGAPNERWSAIDVALHQGHRGLRGGSSLPRLLAARRGVRNRMALPGFTIRQILRWSDDYRRRTGAWPQRESEPRTALPGTNGDTWFAVDGALRTGRRGLPGGSSLAQLLAEHRGVRNVADLPRLSVRQALAWADAHRERAGRWPGLRDWRQEIPGTNGETWGNLMQAVALGLRGLPGGFTLFDLLTTRRGFRNINRLPPLTVPQILAWADAFRARTGTWPTCRSEPQEIPGTGGEKWFNVHQSLLKGLRGLPGRSSLSKLLARHRRVSNTRAPMNTRMRGSRP
jgi:hypothetical protein